MSFLFGSSAEADKKVAPSSAATTGGKSLLLCVPHIEDTHVPLSQDETKLLEDIRTSKSLVPVSAAVKRLMGKATPSQKQRGAKGDGAVFTRATMPAMLFKPVGNGNAVFKLTQEVLSSGAFVTSATLATFNAFAFSVSALDQISPLVALFDQYRIDLIELWFSAEGSAAATATGNFATVIDYDDFNVLSTYAQALDYVNVVSTMMGVSHYRKFVPHIAMAAYSGAFTSFANVTSPWIDAASPSVQHFGVKVAATVTSAVVSYDLTYRLHTSWRNVR